MGVHDTKYAVDNAATSELDTLHQPRAFLRPAASHTSHAPRYGQNGQAGGGALSIISHRCTRSYDIRKLVRRLVDQDAELYRRRPFGAIWGRCILTGFAR